MRIGVDGYNLAIKHGTGVATYSSTLTHILRQAGHQVEGFFGLYGDPRRERREIQFFDRLAHGHRVEGMALVRDVTLSTILNHGPRTPLEVQLTDRVDKRSFGYRFPHFDRLWTSRLLFEDAYARFKYFGRFITLKVPDPPKVMHWTYPVPVRLAGSFNIYTVHDLVPLRLPQLTLDDKSYYHRLVDRCIKTGDHILTVSESSRADIHSLFDVPDSKVTNAFESSAIPAELLSDTRDEDQSAIENMFGLKGGQYFLFFGAVDPKKNIGRIVDAFLASRSERQLVIVSARDWGMEKETKMLGKGGQVYGRSLGNRVVQLEYLPRPTLFRLIRGARAVLFPSLYEGFGLPALEALQMGTPVLGSNVSSLPEVIGDAGLLVDPYSTPQIASAINRLDSDDALVAALRAAAPAQAAKFSDAAFLDRIQAMYRRLGLMTGEAPAVSGTDTGSIPFSDEKAKAPAKPAH